MKYSIIILLIIFGSNCKGNKIDTTTVIGSTLENIENSKYEGIKFNVGEEKCIAVINQYFKNFKQKDKFPYSLWITVETKDKSGYPGEIESNKFITLEDSIISKISCMTPFCYIGHTTRKGYREIIIYVSDKNKTIGIMDNLNNELKAKLKFDIQIDINWENVSGFIN